MTLHFVKRHGAGSMVVSWVHHVGVLVSAGIVGPVRADCLAYDSYRLDRVERLHSPITTFRGTNDVITSAGALQLITSV